jgi:hypothetical protein
MWWRNLINGLKNLKDFFWVVWYFRGWDFSFTYEIIIKCLDRMLESQEKDDAFQSVNSPKIAKRIRICREVLKRILADEYCQKEFDDHYEKYPLKFEGNTFVSSGEKANKELKELYKKEESLKNNDWTLFLKHFRQSERFWT